MFDHQKYSQFKQVQLEDRIWPNRRITEAPTWCSVDLRDGNQALVNPMSVEKKTKMFKLLVQLGFKEIEIGFPSASQPDFDFTRKLIDDDLIPHDVTVQVLTQARKELIDRTYESLIGAKRAIVHLYNSTSAVQREQVFRISSDGILDIAKNGAKWVREASMKFPETEWIFQYSPESFTGTELNHAVTVCDAVVSEWKPEQGQKVIINLPATVEMSTPNIFADQIEYFCRHLAYRNAIIISLHTHNDRGCAVAAAELGVLAGADRIEGTLLGNGERTGNMDIVTMAMNLYSQGIDPNLDFSNIVKIIEVVEDCTEIKIAPRHPWAGELVYTAFSGSHQDAIRKSMQYHEENDQKIWNVAYLPIDPRDINRCYEAVVRINSQSGKGGVALVLERDFGIELPKWLHVSLAKVIQRAAEETGQEISSANIHALYEEYFIKVKQQWLLTDYNLKHRDKHVEAEFYINGVAVQCHGSGPLEALIQGLNKYFACSIEITQFDQHAIESGADSKAQACIELAVNGQHYSAVAIAEDTIAAAVQSVLTAFSRSFPERHRGAA
ncbi:MAG: 2-isopropylmalate synthase [Cellvibrionales bacterium TMED148]|nr:2-isopropylmalate synthase [Porticoccaceae bacterium]RPG92396.1 MAG: 2-isopropylmalate synthase [Cellvibrionales bacterium TMED148]